MAKYTMSILEILQAQETGALTNTDNLYKATQASIFSGNELDAITPEYRKFFALAFARHYLLDEIGVETFALWKILFAGRIFENATYINQLLENQDKLIYDHYQVHLSEVETENKDNSTTTGKDNYTDTNNGSHSSKTTSDGSDTTTLTGSTTRESSGQQHTSEQLGQYDTQAFSNTPQGQLSDVENGTYLTSYQKNQQGGSNSSDGTESSRETESFNNRKDTATHNNTDNTSGTDSNTLKHDATNESKTTSDGTSKTTSKDTTYGILLNEYAAGNAIMDRIWSIFNSLFMAIG